MNKNGSTVTVEVGEEMFVVIANHRSSARGSSTIPAVVGTFTELRLAESAAGNYGKNGEASYGPAVSCDIYSTCLDQHGTCPLVGKWIRPDPATLPVLRPEDCSLFVPGPYTRELMESAPPYSVFIGLVDESLHAELDKVYWETFDVEHDSDLACEKTGLEVFTEEPELDNEFYSEQSVETADDLDAALCYLLKGGALCKVPDEEGSPHYRFLTVNTPGCEFIRGKTE